MNPINAWLLWWKGETEGQILDTQLTETGKKFYKGLKWITAGLVVLGASIVFKNFTK